MNPQTQLMLSPPLVSEDLGSEAKVARFLERLLPRTQAAQQDPAGALLAWVCDRLASGHSRKAYARDLAAFVRHMQGRGVDPLKVRSSGFLCVNGRPLREGVKAPAVLHRLGHVG
jgi:hypothetical protein